mgnify:CR=1 FL=1
MPFLSKSISKLRKISLYLFVVPTIALFLSLIIHNLLVGFSFSSKQIKYDKLPLTIKCNKENLFCNLFQWEKTNNFEDCEKNVVKNYILIEGNKLSFNEYIKKYQTDGKFDENLLEELNPKIIFYKTELLAKRCIKNSIFFNAYKLFPDLFYSLENFKKSGKYQPATATTVNPFIYGETSISNIVKRYPVNLIFKPLLYLSSILMILYWISYNKILSNILNNPKLNKFTIFGIASSIFLFFHVLFLGMDIENDILNKIRRLILVLFIFCEIVAQFFLTRRLYFSFEKINVYLHKSVLNLKIIFVAITLLTTVIILIILSFFNLDSKIDYILEWNYFLFLLVFYFLSSIIWKKIN